MRLLFASVVLLGLLAASSVAQGFEDVPPWHWSRAAIDSLVAGRIIVGFPPNDRDLALNAVVQVYESFAHASHPQAQTWAERFLATSHATGRSRLRDRGSAIFGSTILLCASAEIEAQFRLSLRLFFVQMDQ
ncbi:MAG: hypothetical protein ACRDFA_06305 [bacterium]